MNSDRIAYIFFPRRPSPLLGCMSIATCNDLKKIGKNDQDARRAILDFLEWDEPDDDRFAQDTRIVLASAEFSPEITSSVLWLIDHGIDVRCVRLKPYNVNGRLLVDVQQIIPLPEAEEYQDQFREKAQKERQARASNADFTRFDVQIGDQVHKAMWKRNAIFQICKYLCENGVSLLGEHLNKHHRVDRVSIVADGSVKRENWSRLAGRHTPSRISGAGPIGIRPCTFSKTNSRNTTLNLHRLHNG